MMNLISFDQTPPIGRQDCTTNAAAAAAAAATAPSAMKVKEKGSSRGTCFHSSHLDLSLGISSGGGACDSAGCGGAKASYDGTGRPGCGGGGDDVGCMGIAAANVLGSAGHGGHGIASGGSWTAAFMLSPTGFMHPWSLAARQQKAAAEQDKGLAGVLLPAATYVPRGDGRDVPLPAAVGWPPVHTSRRNVVTTMLGASSAKPPAANAAAVKLAGAKDGAGTTLAAACEKGVAAAPRSGGVATEAARPPPANMFAKVHMDGYLIGRKINLRAHRSYDSLSRVLTKMANNFFCPTDYSSTNMGEEDCINIDHDHIFLYEDFEGDRMLVGDVPWELFVASAKRLYIAQNPASRDHKGHDEATKGDTR